MYQEAESLPIQEDQPIPPQAGAIPLRGASPRKRSRFSVTFDTFSTERIERMAGNDDAKKADIIRHALALEDLYRQTLRDGGQFFIRRADGTIAEIVRP
jgi:hypothetical protein